MRDTAKAQVATLVKRLISRSEETKLVCKSIVNKVLFNSGISGANEVYDVLPNLIQGVDNYQRIGDKVTPKSLTVRGTVAINFNEARSLTPEVHVFIVSHKSKKSYDALNAGTNAGRAQIANELIDAGDGSDIPFDGQVLPTLFPLNRKLLTVHAHKVLKLASSYGAAADQHSSDDTIRFKRFAVKIKCPKTLTYDSSISAIHPVNFAPVMMVGYVYPDGSFSEVLTTPVLVTAASTLYYDDA